MSTYVALPDSPAIPAEAESDIPAAGFWPALSPAHIRAAHRIPTSVPPARLRAALLGAILTVRRDTPAFEAAAQVAGHLTLADVPAPRLDGESLLLLCYRRAVALYAKAELLERTRDFDTTAAGNGLADALSPTVADLRRDAQHAVRDLVGRPRTTVDLL